MTRTSTTKLLIAAVSTLVLIALVAPAQAGRGGSYLKILGAYNNGSSDAIVAELERAENLPCNSICVDFVATLTQDDRYEVRQAAAWWFARRPGPAGALRQDAIDTLTTTTDTIEARNAADVLGTFERPVAIPVLTGAIARTDLGVEARVAIARALGDIGHPAAISGIGIALSDSDAGVRLQAVEAWGQIRFQTDAAPVVALATDSDVLVRRAAIGIIGKFADATARGALEDAVVNDDDPAVRRNAAWSLGRIGDAASRDVLEVATQDDSPLVRNTAKNAIRSLR